MRFLNLEVERFGLFHSQSFDFGDGLFQVIYGPNETGKTTLLQLMRELLFGFAHRNPYSFSDGEMAASAQLELANGDRLRFRRRKGRGNTVTGSFEAGGETIDDLRLGELLGGASEPLYRHVFGFSLTEVADGEKSLRDANLTQALFGGGMGNLSAIQSLEKRLVDDQKKLYSPRGSKPVINELLAKIKEQTTLLRESAVKPADFQQWQQTADDRKREVARLKDAVDRLRAELTKHEKTLRALQCWPKLQELRRELASAGAASAVAPDREPVARQAAKRIDELNVQIAAYERQIAEQHHDLPALQVDESILELEPTVRELSQQIGRMRSCRQDIPRRRQESESIKREVANRLRELNPEWGFGDLDRFRLGVERREAIQALADEAGELDRLEENTRRQSGESDLQLKETRHQLDRLEKVAGDPAIERIVNESPQYSADRAALAKAKREADELADQIERGERSLGSLLNENAGALDTLGVPAAGTVLQFRTRLNKRRMELKQQDDNMSAAQREFTRLHEELSRLDALGRVPDRIELQATRQRRDELWKGLREQVVGGGLVEPNSWDEIEMAMTSADQMADDRQSQAETVAKREQLVVAIDRQKQKLDGMVETRTQVSSELAQVDLEWRQLWHACDINPADPDAMTGWLHDHAVYCGLVRQHRELCGQRETLAASVQDFESRLHKATGGTGTADAMLSAAKQQVEAWRQAVTDRKHYANQLPQLERRRRDLDQQAADLQSRRERAAARWRELVDTMSLPADWQAGLAVRILSSLSEARERYQESMSLDRRVEEMEHDLSAFSSQVAELTGQVPADLSGRPAEDVVEQMSRRLSETKERQFQRRQLEREIAGQTEQRDARRAELQAVQDDVRRLLDEAGVSTLDDLFAAAHAAREVAEKCDRARLLEREINTIRGDEDESHFFARLEQIDAVQAEAKVRAMQAELEKADAEWQEAHDRAVISHARVEEMDTESQASHVALQLEGTRAALGDAVDRWAPLVLAHGLLTRAMKRFEKSHQPKLLADVSDILARMTRGRYTGIKRQMDREGTLLVVRSDGQSREPAQLSTGTREQLYLAIRLAYINHYCRESEPLPMVMDDVLVNFDDQRARDTLEVLLEVAENVQILFLTCHDRMLAMVSDLMSDFRVIKLAGNGQVEARQPVGSMSGVASQEVASQEVATQSSSPQTATGKGPASGKQTSGRNKKAAQSAVADAKPEVQGILFPRG